MDIFTCSVQLR